VPNGLPHNSHDEAQDQHHMEAANDPGTPWGCKLVCTFCQSKCDEWEDGNDWRHTHTRLGADASFSLANLMSL